MDSREKQDLIDEFGPRDDAGSAQQAPSGEQFEFDPSVDMTDDRPAGSGEAPDAPEVPEASGAEDAGAGLDQGVEPMFDFIGGEPAQPKDEIGVDPLTAELAETKDKLLRLAAEFENFKKRRIRERDEQQKFANERLIKDFLPVVDNLERALESARQNGQAQTIIAGLDLVVHEFLRVLSREGVEPMRSVGKPFDPAYQDALQSLETTDYAPGTVVAEILRGYTIYGRVLRAALVVVAREPQSRE